MAHNYERNPGADDARPDRDDGTAVRPKRQGHNYPPDWLCPECGTSPIGLAVVRCATCGTLIHKICAELHRKRGCKVVLSTDPLTVPHLSHDDIDRSIKEIRRDVDELIRTVNQIVRLLRNWVNVYDPELMIENLQEIPIDEPPS